MKICLYSDLAGNNPGGAQKIFQLLVNSLQEARHEVSVFCSSKSKSAIDAHYISTYPRLKSKRHFVKLQCLPFLYQHYFRKPFELLHCHGTYPAAFVASDFCMRRNIPVIIRPYGTDILPDEIIFSNPTLAKRAKHALHSATAIVAQGDSLKVRLLELGVPPGKIVIIPNGTIIPRRSPSVLPLEKRPWLGVGSLSKKKGWDILLKAYAKLPTPRRPLVIIGEGNEREKLTEMIRDLELCGSVKLAGSLDRSDVLDSMRDAWALIAPSRREPFSNSIVEALSLGLPIIASNTGGNVELVKQNENGFMHEVGNVESLASKLLAMEQSLGMRNSMSASSISLSKQYEWNNVFSKYSSLYTRLTKDSN